MNRKRQSIDIATLDSFAAGDADPAAQPLNNTQLLESLRLWADAGWLRRLDVAMAHFVQEQDPKAAPCVLVAAALLTQMEGRGHSCIDVAQLVQQPQTVLAWQAQWQPALLNLWAHLPESVGDWLDALQACPLVRVAEAEPDTGQPLVLAGVQGADPQLYMRRYWDHERLVANHILARGHSDTTTLNVTLARQWLERFFPRAQGTDFDWQKLACAIALRGRFTVITGGPGTGKTYTAARLLALLFATAPDAQQLRVALAAPTGKAAARLKQSIDGALQDLKQSISPEELPLDALVQRVGAARTLHALLGARPDTRHFKHHAGHLLDVDVLIVDEVSMVHLEMMQALLDALPPTARVVLLGDKDQLASVEAGAVLGDLCRDAEHGRYSAETQAYALALTGQVLPVEYVCRDGEAAPALAQHTVMLRRSRRFSGPIGALALAVNAGDADAAHHELAQAMQSHGKASPIYVAQGGSVQQVHALALQGRGAAPGYGAYAEQLQRWPQVQSSGSAEVHAAWVQDVLKAFERFRVLCAVREGEWGVEQINAAVEKALDAQRWIRKNAEWYMGRPVMVTRNDAALGVFNGDIGIALPSGAQGAEHALRVYFWDGQSQLRSVGVARLAHVETAFAMTVHKSQGSEFEHTCMVLSAQAGGVLGRELVYTGITRAREHFTLMAQRPGLLAQAIVSPTRRTSGLPRFLAGEWA